MVTYFPLAPRQFCSIPCRTADLRAGGGWQDRRCEHCDTTFANSGTRLAQGGSRFCSDACRVAHKAIAPKT